MNAPLSTTLRTIRHLQDAGLVDHDPALNRVAARYAVALPAALAEDIAATGRDGPLGRQYLPSAAELDVAPHEAIDPTGDAPYTPVKGVIHRYPDRALLLPTQVCAVYCRFCFRRESVGPAAGALTDTELSAALAYFESRRQIWEVILSGGDPLVLSQRRLTYILDALDRISHVQVIRIHSRVPVAAPERIDDRTLAALAATAKPVYVVVHCNHAAELTPRARAALNRLRRAGAILLSHSVLLAGVNDSEAALEDLFRALVVAGVKPYYLNQLDPAPGTAHFRVPIARGQALTTELRKRLSGIAQPTYVLDTPGGGGKVPIGASFARGIDGGFEVVEGLDGRRYRGAMNDGQSRADGVGGNQ